MDDENDMECPANCADKAPAKGYYCCPVCDREYLDGEDENERG